MATASPTPSPNPNALKFELDAAVPADFGDGHPFAREVLAVEGVAAVFGVSDFVTITRVAGADWDPIVAAVQAAAATHL